MYRCEICYSVSQPGQPMLRHVIHRERPPTPWGCNGGTEIAREVAVCADCLRDLVTMTLTDLTAAHTLTRVARLETERLRRAERQRYEQERTSPPPLFRAQRLKEPEPPPVVLAHPVTITPARKLGRSVRHGRSTSDA